MYDIELRLNISFDVKLVVASLVPIVIFTLLEVIWFNHSKLSLSIESFIYPVAHRKY